MRKPFLTACLLALCAASLTAGFSLGRPAAVKKRVDRLDDKVAAYQAVKAASANLPPVVASVSAVSSVLAAGGTAAVSVSASDPDGDALSYVWSSTAGVFGGSGASVSWVAPSTPGVYALACSVSDGKGGAARGGVILTAVAPGTQKWAFPTGAAVAAAPAIGPDGTIYAASTDGKVYAVNPGGTQKWAFNTGAPVDASPVLDGGRVYFGNNAGVFYAVTASTGGLVWSYTGATAAIRASPAVGAGGTVYFGAADGVLYALDAGGALKSGWFFNGGLPAGTFSASPAIDAYGTVYAGSEDGKVYAVNPEDGSVKWAVIPGGGTAIRSSPAIGADGAIYEGSDDGVLYALDYVNGAPLSGWPVMPLASGYSIRSSPAIGLDGTVYTGDGDGNLYAVDPSGVVKWKTLLAAGGTVASSPAIGADGTVYVGADDGSLHALAGATGAQKWVSAAGSLPVTSSPAIGADGTVYVGADYGLYAFYGTSPLASAPWPKFRRNNANTGR